jgi:hypothetical protein
VSTTLLKVSRFNLNGYPKIGYYHLCGIDPSVIQETEFSPFAEVFNGAWSRITNVIQIAHPFGIGVLLGRSPYSCCPDTNQFDLNRLTRRTGSLTLAHPRHPCFSNKRRICLTPSACSEFSSTLSTCIRHPFQTFSESIKTTTSLLKVKGLKPSWFAYLYRRLLETRIIRRLYQLSTPISFRCFKSSPLPLFHSTRYVSQIRMPTFLASSLKSKSVN